MANKILVVGDVMFDRYIYVDSTRKAPEADIPVWDEIKREVRLGGAANVAANIASLSRDDDNEIFLAGITDSMDRKRFRSSGIDSTICAGSRSMYKERYVDQNMKYVFRHDNIKKFEAEDVKTLKKSIQHFCQGHLFHAIIFSDYDKGTIDEEIVNLVSRCKTNETITVVDSKRLDLSLYSGFDVLKVNESEYAAQIRAPYRNVESLFRNVVVTKGAKGAALVTSAPYVRDRKRDIVIREACDRYITTTEEFHTISVNATDVTGCGDTHTAAMTYSLLKNRDVRSAIKFANECSRKVVQRFGTSVV